MNYDKIKISASVIIPIDIEIPVNEAAPDACGQYRDWFHAQLEQGVKAFVEEHIKISDGFVDVAGLAVGDSHGSCHLSEWQSKDLFKRLAAIVQAKLELNDQVQKVMKVTNE